MDKRKRLDFNLLKALSGETGFKEELLEKDYYLTLILYLLKDVEGIYFKGGTALQKIFLNYSRLSEDADYTVTEELDMIKKEIKNILIESKIFKKITRDKDVDGFVRIVATYENIYGNDDVVFIDLNKRAKLLTKPEKHQIKHFYDEEVPTFSVNTLSKAEMFAEKMAATIGRNKPRDHFDIFMLLKNNFEIDYDLAKEKCRQSGVEFDIIKMFDKARKLNKRWNEDMLPLLSQEIEFKEVMVTLAKHFDLKQKKEDKKD